MLPTQDDVLGIRMDAGANFNSTTKRLYSSLIRCPWQGILLCINSTFIYCVVYYSVFRYTLALILYQTLDFVYRFFVFFCFNG